MTHRRSLISVTLPGSFNVEHNFDIGRSPILLRSAGGHRRDCGCDSTFYRYLSLRWRCYLERFSPGLTITSKGSDGLKPTSITLNHVRRSALRDIRKRVGNLSARGLFTRRVLAGAAEARMAPFHLFHLDSRTDGSDRIRKRHLIRRRGHFTFCPPVCPSVRPSMCRVSFPSFPLFAPRRPTDQSRHVRTPPPRIDHATRAEIAPATDSNRRDFFPRYSAPAVRASIRARGWMVLREREGKKSGQTERSEDGHDTTSWAVYG